MKYDVKYLWLDMSFIDFVIITNEFFGILKTSRTAFIEISEYKNYSNCNKMV